jgi:quinol monooxygenase YgiN
VEIQVITFRLMAMTREHYEALCDEIAPAVAAVPGLISTDWLADESTNTYGGVYTWRDRPAIEAFLKSDLFRLLANHPHLADIRSRVFSVLESPSAVTARAREVAA